ncbi:hypothetical protein P8C59_007471 [Phyllachora maydis]|uniref:Apple domain-containing protein n=1 Tax=Phyllachora maydis TaxID=1825666 RepID=A0AAD9MGY1_9PEZI|nr:hypothetical protein P8C59_007471 [Phyllachora maydis]
MTTRRRSGGFSEKHRAGSSPNNMKFLALLSTASLLVPAGNALVQAGQRSDGAQVEKEDLHERRGWGSRWRHRAVLPGDGTARTVLPPLHGAGSPGLSTTAPDITDIGVRMSSSFVPGVSTSLPDVLTSPAPAVTTVVENSTVTVDVTSVLIGTPTTSIGLSSTLLPGVPTNTPIASAIPTTLGLSSTLLPGVQTNTSIASAAPTILGFTTLLPGVRTNTSIVSVAATTPALTNVTMVMSAGPVTAPLPTSLPGPSNSSSICLITVTTQTTCRHCGLTASRNASFTQTIVIDTTVTPASLETMTSSFTTVVPITTTVGSSAPSGTPDLGTAHCGVHGSPNGNWRLAQYDYNTGSEPVTLVGCWEFCLYSQSFDGGCKSYDFFFNELGASRCQLYGSTVAYALASVDNHQPDLWYDLGCGNPSASTTKSKRRVVSGGKPGDLTALRWE